MKDARLKEMQQELRRVKEESLNGTTNWLESALIVIALQDSIIHFFINNSISHKRGESGNDASLSPIKEKKAA